MWLYNGKEFTSNDIDKYIGFVYCITNLSDGRKYIGKKIFHHKKWKQVNKKRKAIKVESDWLTYYGSSDILLEDVKQLGEDKFKREILRLCKNKSECSYYEAKEQFLNDVLLSDMWYNNWISCKITSKHMQSLKETI